MVRAAQPRGPDNAHQPRRTAGGLRMTGTSQQVVEAASVAGRVLRTENDGTTASGDRPGFLEWVTRLAHTHRGRLYRLARREGLREEDSFDCVQDAFHTFLL